ncbi:MAG: geranylgeranylglyceryl/heptaprenylglyceryl phosphate synthase [Thermoproteota archaeon]
MVGNIESSILNRLAKEKCLHFILLDPQKPNNVGKIVHYAERSGTSAILVGGSTAMLTSEYDAIIEQIKKNSNLPVIIFPSNLPSLTNKADAIFFMSLLNSINPYFITGAQALGVGVIKKYRIEAIPLAYIIVGEGGSAGFVGQAQCIPIQHPELAAGYAMAAETFGFRFVYLEAGSGAEKAISPKFVSEVKKRISIPLIVGGGIKTESQAQALATAGADILVTGTIIEKTDNYDKIAKLVNAIRRGVKSRS